MGPTEVEGSGAVLSVTFDKRDGSIFNEQHYDFNFEACQFG